MALPVRKGYKGAPAQAVLTNSPTSGDTSFVVDTVTGWATTFPFYCVVDPGTSKEEKVKVTAISTLTLTVVRAQDDTSASGHSAGAAIYPVFTADEADEANLVASVMTTKGDVIATDGSTINRLGVGTNTHVLQADSTATNGFKWGQVVEAGIADSAITSAKILDGTIVNGDINAAAAIDKTKISGTAVTVADTGTITSTMLLDGTILNADINASAAIALSKLATGALPTAITVASANIVDGTIVAGDIADGAVDKAKIGSGPRGIVAYGSTTTSDTTITTDEIQITCSTFTAVAGRYYRITYYEPLLVIPNGAHMQASISGYQQPVIETALIQNPRSSGDHYQFMNLSLVTTLPAGSTVMRGVLVTNSGTGQATRTSERPAWVCVEDIGTL